MGKILLTGVTGLVGSAFVVALLREKPAERFVCIARSNGGGSAADRVAKVLREQCEFDGCSEIADSVISCVEVVDGDVVDIVPEELVKLDVLKDVDRVFHCAADVNLGKDPTGKTFKINYGGTINMVKLAQLLNVKELHYVSTAYVAGKISGRAAEEQALNSGFNHPYEESKFKAEMLVRNSGIPFSIYRPAIVTGRRSDGRIRKPLAFYRLLEFLGKFKSHNCTRAGVSPLEWINMSMAFSTVPSEHVYFVPIDYVQEAITALFQKPVTNTAYHITGDSPLSVKQIRDTICGVLRLDGLTVGMNDSAQVDTKLMARFVGDLFPYFSSDIVFDQSNVKKVMGEKFLDWEYGTKGLEILIRSYYKDYFPKVEWIQTLAAEPIQRAPKDN